MFVRVLCIIADVVRVAMGNGPGGLFEYQEAFRYYERLQGGFIWEWANHGLWKEEPSGKNFFAYGGDYGDIPNDGTFVMDGLCHSDHTPTAGMVEFKKIIEPVHGWVEGSNIVIENRYQHQDLEHLTATFKLESIGER